jgi:hypothetical protein
MECKRAAQHSELETVIFVLRDALIVWPAHYPHRSDSLNDLAGALVARFWQSGDPQDLEEAIVFHDEALKLRKDGLEAVAEVSDESQLLVRLFPSRLFSDYEPTNILGWPGYSTV